MRSVSSRIWTRVAVSISYDNNDYTTGTSIKVSYGGRKYLKKKRFKQIDWGEKKAIRGRPMKKQIKKTKQNTSMNKWE